MNDQHATPKMIDIQNNFRNEKFIKIVNGYGSKEGRRRNDDKKNTRKVA